jgi:dihydropyrimidine dehydrogenase (NAD+) subunit PreA
MVIDTSFYLGKKQVSTPLLVAAGQPTGAPGKIKDFSGRMAENKWGGIVTKTISCGTHFLLRPHFWKSEEYGLSAMQNYGPTHSSFSQGLMDDLAQDVLACHREGLILIANIQGTTLEEWKQLATALASTGVDGIELNISFSHFTMKYSDGPENEEESETSKIAKLLKDIVKVTTESVTLPVIPKITAHHTYPVEIAQICKRAGASGISAINTLRGIIGVDVKSKRPISRDVAGKAFIGGISGAIIKPVALATVADIVKRAKIPVYGIGGINDWESAVQFLLVGAQAFQVCTGVMLEGFRIGKRIYDGLTKYMQENGYQTLNDFRGVALEYISDDPFTRMEAISVIDPQKCTKCLRCFTACKEAGYQAILTDKKADFLLRILPEKCTGCGLCQITCKDGAVEIRKR